jgi:hypothetical protein
MALLQIPTLEYRGNPHLSVNSLPACVLVIPRW